MLYLISVAWALDTASSVATAGQTRSTALSASTAPAHTAILREQSSDATGRVDARSDARSEETAKRKRGDPQETAPSFVEADMPHACENATAHTSFVQTVSTAKFWGAFGGVINWGVPQVMTAVVAIGFMLNTCWRKCFTYEAWWYDLDCAKQFRRDTFGENKTFEMSLYVHKVKWSLPRDSKLVVGLRMMREMSSKKPILKTCHFRTGETKNGTWEQRLIVRVKQGFPMAQVGIFQKAAITGHSLVAYGTLDLTDGLAEPMERESVELMNTKGLPVGSLIISAKKKDKSDAEAFDTASFSSNPSASREQSGDAGAESSSEAESSEQAPKGHEEAAAGALRVENSSGEWELRYFRIEKKSRRRHGGPEMTVATWAWYEDRRCSKPVGHLPLLAIRGVSPVPNSISEFVVRYEDTQKFARDMLLQRVSQDRDIWVATLKKLIDSARKERKERRDVTAAVSETTNKDTENEDTEDQSSMSRSRSGSRTRTSISLPDSAASSRVRRSSRQKTPAG